MKKKIYARLPGNSQFWVNLGKLAIAAAIISSNVALLVFYLGGKKYNLFGVVLIAFALAMGLLYALGTNVSVLGLLASSLLTVLSFFAFRRGYGALALTLSFFAVGSAFHAPFKTMAEVTAFVQLILNYSWLALYGIELAVRPIVLPANKKTL